MGGTDKRGEVVGLLGRLLEHLGGELQRSPDLAAKLFPPDLIEACLKAVAGREVYAAKLRDRRVGKGQLVAILREEFGPDAVPKGGSRERLVEAILARAAEAGGDARLEAIVAGLKAGKYGEAEAGGAVAAGPPPDVPNVYELARATPRDAFVSALGAMEPETLRRTIKAFGLGACRSRTAPALAAFVADRVYAKVGASFQTYKSRRERLDEARALLQDVAAGRVAAAEVRARLAGAREVAEELTDDERRALAALLGTE